jgi:hypothetical protein
LNNSATILFSDGNNRLEKVKGILVIFLLAIAAMVAAFFLFEKEILNFAVPKLPKDDGKTAAYYFDLFRLGAFELLWTALIICITLLFYTSQGLLMQFNGLEEFMLNKPKIFLRTVVTLCACFLLLNAFIVLEQFPNSSDEYVYVYQAKTLSHGKLWQEAHPIEKSFEFNHIATKDGINVGRFPMGWPLILSFFLILGIPGALVNPILAIVTLFVFYSLAKRLYGPRVAGWSLLFLSASGFFLFNSSSFFSHTSCLLETLVFVYCIHLYQENQKAKYGLLAGVALGLIMLIRYYTAFLLFIPFFLLLLYQYRLKAIRLFVLVGLGALPLMIAFLWYNYAITGNPLTPVTVWGYQHEGLGFINGHTFMGGIEHIVRRFAMFCYWSSPVFLILYFVFLWKKIFNPEERLMVPEDYFFIAFIIGYFFYYEIGGNQYGPRFYFEAFPFLILLVVRKVLLQENYVLKLFLFASLVVMIIRLPLMAHREHRIIEERRDVYNTVQAKGVKHAVILLTSGTSVTRPMPSGDLTRNDELFQNDVLYAISDEKYNDMLMQYYKDRSFYKYVRKPESTHGLLIKIR